MTTARLKSRRVALRPDHIPSADWRRDRHSQLSRGDERLLRRRIKTLPRRVAGTTVDRAFHLVLDELRGAGLGFYRPQLIVGDSWAYYDGLDVIAAPFWAIDERFFSIHRRVMLSRHQCVERYGRSTRALSSLRRILRHEFGHALADRYGLTRTRGFRRLFGNPDIYYNPAVYHALPGHPDFADNTGDGYGQAHPDEDFAETFAVWLDPKSDWRRVYRARPRALAKLNFIDRAMARASKKPRRARGGPDRARTVGLMLGSAGDVRTVAEYLDDRVDRIRDRLDETALAAKDRRRRRLATP